MGLSKNLKAHPCRAFRGISASENLSVPALRTPCFFFLELPQNSRQLYTLGFLEKPFYDFTLLFAFEQYFKLIFKP
jgi:hypothetical protein